MRQLKLLRLLKTTFSFGREPVQITSRFNRTQLDLPFVRPIREVEVPREMAEMAEAKTHATNVDKAVIGPLRALIALEELIHLQEMICEPWSETSAQKLKYWSEMCRIARDKKRIEPTPLKRKRDRARWLQEVALADLRERQAIDLEARVSGQDPSPEPGQVQKTDDSGKGDVSEQESAFAALATRLAKNEFDRRTGVAGGHWISSKPDL